MATVKAILATIVACVLVTGVQLAAGSGALADEGDRRPQLFNLNEDMLRALERTDTVDIKEQRSVLYALLSQIKPRAEILPSENYYYFSFYDHGLPYSGSLRLAAESRDKGVLELNYNKSYDRSQAPDAGIETTLSAKDGVEVIKLDKFLYRVVYKDVAVTFKLHELKMELTPSTKLFKGEIYIASLYDESGIEFDIVYSTPRNGFMYLLKTDKPGCEPTKSIGSNMFVGERSGFVYYRDSLFNRDILIAVNADRVYENSYYDGPFDQLPENYYDKIDLFKYIYKVYPNLNGELNSFGSYKDGSIFALIAYRQYRSLTELRYVRKCKPGVGDRNIFYSCILGRYRSALHPISPRR